MRRLLPLVAAGVAIALAAPPVAPAAAPAAAVRVDQLGFTPGETKIAYLLSDRLCRRAAVRVGAGAGRVVPGDARS